LLFLSFEGVLLEMCLSWRFSLGGFLVFFLVLGELGKLLPMYSYPLNKPKRYHKQVQQEVDTLYRSLSKQHSVLQYFLIDFFILKHFLHVLFLEIAISLILLGILIKFRGGIYHWEEGSIDFVFEKIVPWEILEPWVTFYLLWSICA